MDERALAARRPSVQAVVLVAAAAVVLLAALYYRLAYGSVANLVAALDHCQELYCDFTRQYYPTGRDLLATGRPSNGYFYSSFFALLLAPFGRVELSTAVALWTLVQLLGLALLLLPAVDFYRETPVAAVVYVALLALSMPLLHNLKWGQVSTLVTGGALATLFLCRRGRPAAAAVVLALASAVKYYVAIVAFYFLLRRQWRFLLTLAVAFAVLWLVVPTVALGPRANWEFYQIVRERVAHAVTTWMAEDINAQYLPSVAGRWLGTDAGRGLWRLVGYALFALNGLAVARLVRRGVRREAEWAFALLFLGLPLAIETSWPHYFVYLPFAQTLAWLALRETAGRARWPVAALLAASVVLASMPFFALVGRWQDYSRYGVLFLANLCLLLAAHLLTARPAARSDRPASPGEPAAVGR